MDNPNEVKLFLEGCRWDHVGLKPVFESTEETSPEPQDSASTEELSEVIEEGFYTVDDDLVFVNENQDIFEVFTDDEDGVFVYNEEYGLFQVFDGDEGMIFEEVDTDSVEVLEEVDAEDADETDEE